MTTYTQPPSHYGSGFREQTVEDATLDILSKLG